MRTAMPRPFRPLSWLLALALGLVPAPAAHGEEPSTFELRGVPAVVTPPKGLTGEAKQTAPGQWQVTWRGTGTNHLLQARVFPVRASREPGPVLVQAIDTLVRGSTLGGFGMSGQRVFELWGQPAAEASIEIAVDGKVARGFARLLLVNNHQWALAWGIVAPPELARGTLARVRRFVRTLEPRDPTFFDPRFAAPADLATVVYAHPGEARIRRVQLRAICGLVEAGLGRRFPLEIRGHVETMLLQDVQQGSPATRAGYLASAEDVTRSMALAPGPRAERMEALGQRIVTAIRKRAQASYRPAIGIRRIWFNDAESVVGSGDSAWQYGTLRAELEVSAFLVSLVLDEAHEVPAGALVAHAKTLSTAWKALDPEGRAARHAVRQDWARWRHAWDTATPAKRVACRRAVAVALSPKADRAAIPAAADARDLKRWMATRRRPDLVLALWKAALALPATERQALAERLGVEVSGYQLGW